MTEKTRKASKKKEAQEAALEVAEEPKARPSRSRRKARAEEEEPVAAGVAVTEEVPEGPQDPRRRWYVVHTYSGYENKVKENLLKRRDSLGLRDEIFGVLVPTEEEIEFKDGKKRTVQKKVYPGYVLVDMIMSDRSWYVVRNTPGVTGFVSPGSAGVPDPSSPTARRWPVPLPDEDVRKIKQLMGMEAPTRVKIDLAVGDTVRVTHGPFQDFHGLVEEVSPEREKVRVLISIFGRETPVELDFGQVEKLE